MKILAWIVGLIMVLAVIIFGAQIIASETGEVVVLHTDDDGRDATTRLWVVEHDGHQWLRAGADSGWYLRLLAEPRVRLERDGVTRTYTARPDPDTVGAVNELMARKYGWRDAVVGLLAPDRDEAQAIRLIPAD
ncbi:MAG: nitroreductase/quinone reductase family protein [Gammaproteobacteria bacterium]|nr:nitroreductase/quinone reductase family protein [Gammaproteobacteria bacterium]